MANQEENNKSVYEKPKLRVIDLAAEEVMATGCKTIAGTSIGKMGQPCSTGQCVSTGS